MSRITKAITAPFRARVGPLFALDALLLHLGTKHREFDR